MVSALSAALFGRWYATPESCSVRMSSAVSGERREMALTLRGIKEEHSIFKASNELFLLLNVNFEEQTSRSTYGRNQHVTCSQNNCCSLM